MPAAVRDVTVQGLYIDRQNRLREMAEKGLTGQRKARGAVSFQEVFDELIDRRIPD